MAKVAHPARDGRTVRAVHRARTGVQTIRVVRPEKAVHAEIVARLEGASHEGASHGAANHQAVRLQDVSREMVRRAAARSGLGQGHVVNR
ncbi:hypothetical protein GCM10007854_18590 [Algimonas porphyrae]|uniref:Uncharacterized protein n=1 Tax=Algimonas porphyrae TaxID=1128113 RepID=A0ABQ5V157_9PROT|nr:hypothetical protein GCM10007854_18590 [Algimonas porphyrae]